MGFLTVILKKVLLITQEIAEIFEVRHLRECLQDNLLYSCSC